MLGADHNFESLGDKIKTAPNLKDVICNLVENETWNLHLTKTTVLFFSSPKLALEIKFSEVDVVWYWKGGDSLIYFNLSH